jgi:glutathione S-transferase
MSFASTTPNATNDPESEIVLVSHHLCPYVQRAVIALTEKGVPFERRNVDLSRKPEWFTALSPLGKTPVLVVDGRPIFESAVILEYLEETQPRPLHPSDPLARARHRSWIEVASAILNDIARFYAAPDVETFDAARSRLAAQFRRVEDELGTRPWFDGEPFSLVDAAFGPVFRYFDVFERIGDFGVLDGLGKVSRWRAALATRPSVREAVAFDYPERLDAFLRARGSRLSTLMADPNLAKAS